MEIREVLMLITCGLAIGTTIFSAGIFRAVVRNLQERFTALESQMDSLVAITADIKTVVKITEDLQHTVYDGLYPRLGKAEAAIASIQAICKERMKRER